MAGIWILLHSLEDHMVGLFAFFSDVLVVAPPDALDQVRCVEYLKGGIGAYRRIDSRLDHSVSTKPICRLHLRALSSWRQAYVTPSYLGQF